MKTTIFNNINTKEKAYWLGFLAADGYIAKDSNKVQLCLSIKDEDQVDRFIKFIDGDFKRKTYYIGSFNTTRVFFTIHNREIADAIKRLGIVSPKGKNLKLPELKTERLNLAFIMGFYDGDGCARNPMVSCGSKKFLLALKNKYLIQSKVKFEKNHLGSTYNLYIGMNFLKVLMKNFKGSMPRKRDLLTGVLNKDLCNCGMMKIKKSKTCKTCFQKSGTKINLTLTEITTLLEKNPLEDVAKQLGLSSTGLKKRMIKLGINLKSVNPRSFINKKIIHKKIWRLLLKNTSRSQIVKELGVTMGTVKECIRKKRVEYPNHRFFRKIDETKIIDYYNKSGNYRKTARKFKMYHSKVRRIVQKCFKNNKI